MFVFDDAGIWNIGISEVHDGAALEIWHVKRLLLESYTTPFQLPEAIIKEFVYLTSVENVVCNTFSMLSVIKEIRIDTCLYAIKQSIYEFVVATNRNTLISIAEVIVVMNKTNGQAFDDKSRQVCTFAPPLFFGISLNQCFVNVFTY